MSIINSHRRQRSLPDPVSTAQGFVALQALLGTPDPDGIRFTTMRALSADANGPHTRKRAGYFRNEHTLAIAVHLAGRNEVAYCSHADAVLRSHIEDGRLPIPINKRADVLAMIPGDQVIVVAATNTQLGHDLLEGRVDLVYDRDGDRPYDIMKRVQRANALDVLAVLAFAHPLWGKS